MLLINFLISGDGYTTCSDAGSASKPSLLNMVGDAIRQVQRDIEKDKARLSSPSNGPVVYNPTPLAHCSTAALLRSSHPWLLPPLGLGLGLVLVGLTRLL